MTDTHSRRRFLQAAGVGATVCVAGTGAGLAQQSDQAKQTPRQELKLGIASYTFRNFDLDKTLAMTKRVGLRYIAFKDFHLPLNSTDEQIQQVVQKVKDAGLELYGGGVIYMRSEAEVQRAFDYAKAAGMKVIIGVANWELLPLVDKKVQEYDIKVAIHNHGPTDKLYPTPASVYERIKNLDKRIGLCNDVGHTQRAGLDPAEQTERYADRMLDVHIKDVSAATAKGQSIEAGRGVIDIPKLVRTLLKIKFTGIVSFEYEKDADDPLPGLAESVGYVRGVLAAL
jgi:sugar phosphate isomerase/epimerase